MSLQCRHLWAKFRPDEDRSTFNGTDADIWRWNKQTLGIERCKGGAAVSFYAVEGSVPLFVDHMELVISKVILGISYLDVESGFFFNLSIPTFNTYENFLNCSNFEYIPTEIRYTIVLYHRISMIYPNPKSVSTGSLSVVPNLILHHYEHITDRLTQSSFNKPAPPFVSMMQ